MFEKKKKEKLLVQTKPLKFNFFVVQRVKRMLLLLLLCAALQNSVKASPVTESSPIVPTTDSNLCPCPDNSTITSTTASTAQNKIPNMLIHGMTCMCHAGSSHNGEVARDDYKYSPGIGAHKLHTRATTWNEARKMCNEEGGHLAIVNSLSEAHVSFFFLLI